MVKIKLEIAGQESLVEVPGVVPRSDYDDLLQQTNVLVDRVMEAEKKIEGASAILTDSKIDPTGSTSGAVVLRPGDSIKEHLKDGVRILLREGVYEQYIDFSNYQDITIESHRDNKYKPIIGGLYEPEWEWVQDAAGIWITSYPGIKGLWHWKDDHPDGAFNSKYMYPLLATIGNDPLQWLPDGHGEGPGFYVDSAPDSPGNISVRLDEGQDISDFRISRLPYLVIGNDNTKGIKLSQIHFKGCSNTGKTGAVNTPGSNWHIADCTIDLANTIGLEFGQGGLRSNMHSSTVNGLFERILVRKAGQMGCWGSMVNCDLIDFTHEESNAKGFSYWWEASCKLQNTKNSRIKRFKGKNVRGPVLWLDINNHDNEIDGVEGDGFMLACVFLEHYASGNIVKNVVAKNGSSHGFDPEADWGVNAGVLIQSNVNNNRFEGIHVDNVEDGIRINNGDGRGDSDYNVFTGLITTNVKNPLRVLPDGKILSNEVV